MKMKDESNCLPLENVLCLAGLFTHYLLFFFFLIFPPVDPVSNDYKTESGHLT